MCPMSIPLALALEELELEGAEYTQALDEADTDHSYYSGKGRRYDTVTAPDST